MTTAPVKQKTMIDYPRRQDRAYADFVASLGGVNSEQLRPAMRRIYDQKAKAWEAERGAPPKTLDDAKAMLDEEPTVRWYKHLERHRQEMNWNGSITAVNVLAPELERELAESDSRGPGKLILDPDLKYPEYFDSVDFHIQPGSYHRYPLSGYIYHFGLRGFHLGRGTDPDDRKREFAMTAPVPADGRVERVLDLATGLGQGAQAWKQRYPQAEVWGIDIAAPAVRYAHRWAIDQGLELNFAQMAAEDLKFPDDHFDVVYSYILFHEVPVDAAEQIVREAHRVLRPGGTFTVLDFGSTRTWSPWDYYMRDYDQHSNGEPYSMEFCEWDMAGSLRAAGFSAVHEDQVGFHGRRWAVK